MNFYEFLDQNDFYVPINTGKNFIKFKLKLADTCQEAMYASLLGTVDLVNIKHQVMRGNNLLFSCDNRVIWPVRSA